MSRRVYELKLTHKGVQLEPSLKTPLPMSPAERQAAIGWLFSQARKILDDDKKKEQEAAVTVLHTKSVFIAPPARVKAAALLPPSVKIPRLIKVGFEPIPRAEGSMNVVVSPQKFTQQRSLFYDRSGVPTTYTESSVASWDNSRRGVDLPNHRAVIEAGGNATTALTATRQTMSVTSGFLEIVTMAESTGSKTNTDAMSGVFACGPLVATTDSGLLAKCNTGALEKFHRRLAAVSRSADVGETLAEFGQALRMVKRPLAGMRDLLDKTAAQAEKLKWSRYGSTAKTRLTQKDAALAAAKLHLEFNFGWKPLALDLLAALKEAQVSRLAVCPSKINASFKLDKLLSSTSSVVPYLNHFRLNQTVEDTLACTVRYQVGLSPEKSKTDPYSYMKAIGLSPDRFIPTLYAVIPYSWLFDYFTALNVAIDALCADLSFTTWTCKTVRWQRTQTTVRDLNVGAVKTLFASSPNALLGLSGSPFVNTVVRHDVSRSIPASLVPDLITLKMPQGAGQIKNIVALLATKVR